MKVIEFETYTPSADDPRRQEYAGQRTGREVFAELKQRLESLGLLPDEYFLIGREWEKGEDIPKDADMFVTTDYIPLASSPIWLRLKTQASTSLESPRNCSYFTPSQ